MIQPKSICANQRLPATTLALAFAFTVPNVAFSQDQPGATQSESPRSAEEFGRLEEIVVTAQRREEFLSKIPVPITALSGEDMASRGIVNTMDLNNIAPGLHANFGNNSSMITVRGIGILTSNDILSPSASFNVDGVTMGRPRMTTMQFYDVARIEVLRGPQGTLYGRNAAAGSINLITNAPSSDAFGGRVSVGGGSFGSVEATAALNLPLNDRLAVRLATRYDTHENYTDRENFPANAAVQRGVQDSVDSVGGRLSVLFTPTDALTWKLTGDYSQIDGYEPAVTVLTNPLTSNPASLNNPLPFAGTTGRSDLTSNLGGFQRLINYGVNSQLSYDFPLATLTYQAGYRYFDESIDAFIGYLSAANAASSQVSGETFYDGHQYTHELRLNSAASQRVKWVLGAYSYEDNQDYVVTFRPVLPPPGSFTRIADHPDSDTKSWAVFGQVTYPLTDALSVTGGLRYTDDSLDAINITALGVSSAERFSSSSTDYRVALDYQLTEQHLLYGSVSTGYKAGGSNYGNGVSFAPETVIDYELGFKGRFLDDRMELNANVFYFEYEDVQQSTFVPTATIPLVLVQNAALANNQGLEVETAFQVTDHDRFEAGLALQEARFDSFPNCILAGGAVADCSGTPLPLAPDSVFRLSYQHEFPFGNGSSLTVRAAERWSSSYNLTLGDTRFFEQPSYNVTDLSAEWESAGESWSVQGYVRNLEDTNIVTIYGGGTYWPAFNLEPPRLIGARIDYRF